MKSVKALKSMQNANGSIKLKDGYDPKIGRIWKEHAVSTMMTKVFIHSSNKLSSPVIYSAGCNKASDFDYDALIAFAIHKFGKEIAS